MYMIMAVIHWYSVDYYTQVTQLLTVHMKKKKKKRTAQRERLNVLSARAAAISPPSFFFFSFQNSTSFFLFSSSSSSSTLSFFFTLSSPSLSLPLRRYPLASPACCPVWRDPIKAADFGVQLELSHRIFHADNTRPKLSTSSSSLTSHPVDFKQYLLTS